MEDQLLADVPSDTPSCVRTAYVRRNLNVRLASPVTNLVNQQGNRNSREVPF